MMEEDNLSALLDACFELLWLEVHACFIVHTFHWPLNNDLYFPLWKLLTRIL